MNQVTPVNESALKAQRAGQMVFFGVLLVAFLCFTLFFPRLSFPLAIAYVFALALRPLRAFYLGSGKRRRVIFLVSSVVIITLLIYPLVLVASTLPQELADLAKSLPKFEGLLREKFIEFKYFMYSAFHIRLEFDPVVLVVNKIRKSGEAMLILIPQIMGNLLEWSLLTPLFCWFLISEGNRLKTGFLGIVPNAWFERSYMLLHQFNGKFGDYIIAKSIEAFILGVLVTTGLWFIGFPYATLLGVIAGITNILPYVGPVIGWVPALLVGALQAKGTVNMFGMNMVFIVANLVDMTLVFPLLVSKIVNLHPLVVVSSVIMGSQIGGVGGMLISVPVAAFLKLLITEIYRSLYPERAS